MAPLGHAVRLVHHQERNVQRMQQIHEPRRFHALRRHVQQLCVAPGHLIQRLADLTRAHGAVDHHGVHAQLHQLIHLILHQRDQRADHNGHAVQQQRRNLIGQRLASARGQHRHHVPTVQYGRDDLLLSGPERVVAEHALEHVVHPLLHVTAPSREKIRFHCIEICRVFPASGRVLFWVAKLSPAPCDRATASPPGKSRKTPTL